MSNDRYEDLSKGETYAALVGGVLSGTASSLAADQLAENYELANELVSYTLLAPEETASYIAVGTAGFFGGSLAFMEGVKSVKEYLGGEDSAEN